MNVDDRRENMLLRSKIGYENVSSNCTAHVNAKNLNTSPVFWIRRMKENAHSLQGTIDDYSHGSRIVCMRYS